jgi:hypothetical protein
VPVGEGWLQSASIPLSIDYLHQLALTSKTPLIIQARSTYGHFRTASQMHKVPGIYWPTAAGGLKTSLQQEPLRINPQPVSPALARLKALYSDTIRGLILVIDHSYTDGRVLTPYITINAAPLLITLGHFSVEDPPSRH